MNSAGNRAVFLSYAPLLRGQFQRGVEPSRDFPPAHCTDVSSSFRLRAAARATALTIAASSSDSATGARLASPRPAADATAFVRSFLARARFPAGWDFPT